MFRFGSALLILLTTHFAWNQTSDKETQWKFGLKAGMNFAELWGDDALPESDRKFGYSVGCFAQRQIKGNWSWQPELIWSLQGEKSESSGRYKISYLNIPMMLKWKEDHMYYEFGPQLGILTINTSESIPDSLRLKNFETFDFSLNAGFGFLIDDNWSIGLRYIQGLTNLVSGKDLKNSVFYLGFSYKLF